MKIAFELNTRRITDDTPIDGVIVGSLCYPARYEFEYEANSQGDLAQIDAEIAELYQQYRSRVYLAVCAIIKGEGWPGAPILKDRLGWTDILYLPDPDAYAELESDAATASAPR